MTGNHSSSEHDRRGRLVDTRPSHRIFRAGISVLLSGICCGAWVPSMAAATVEELQLAYTDFRAWQASTNDESGVRIITEEDGNKVSMRISIASDEDSFEALAEPLSRIENWCKIKSLHLNIKACVYDTASEPPQLTFYTGKKEYQKPKDAEKLTLNFQSSVGDAHMSTELSADSGPFGTKNYRIGFDMIPTDAGVYAEFRISQEIGFMVRQAMKVYLSTVASDKVGFTVTGTNENNEPEYVGGIQGMSERNLIRYLLAIDVVIKTLEDTGPDAYLERAAMWFDATEQYPEQLREVSREDYLEAKRREHENQARLQAKVSN